MDKAYERIVWHNEPSILTPLNETNLNKMDSSLDVIDNRVVTMDTTKANQSDLLQTVKTVTYNTTTGVFTFTFWNGSTVTADLNIEKIPVDFSMSPEGVITMRTADGTEYTCDISELIKLYTFVDSSEIDFTTTTDASGNKIITAQIKAGSITGEKLQPNYLADCLAAKSGAEVAESNAQGYATDADVDALKSEGWAVGEQNGVPVPSTSPYYHNNSKYWSEQSNPTRFSSLSDVNFGTLEDGDVPVYDATSQKWKNEVGVSADLKSNTTGQFNTRTGGILNSCVINLEPIQSGSGTPSPENVRPIAGHTAVKVWEHGKNYLPMTLDSIKSLNTSGTWSGNVCVLYGVTFTVLTDNDGNVTGIKANGTASATFRFTAGMLDVTQGQKILGCPSYGSDSTFSITTNSNIGNDFGNGFNASASANNCQIQIRLYNSYQANNLIFKPMVTNDQSVTYATFAPYQGQDITISLGQTVYGGSLDAVSGVLTVTWVSERMLNTYGWSLNTNPIVDRRFQWNYGSGTAIPKGINQNGTFICSHLNPSNLNVNSNPFGYFYISNNWIVIPDRDSFFATIDDFKNWLSNNQVYICYKLGTPIEIQLTPQQIETLIGENNISVPLEGQTLDSLTYREMMAWDDVEKAVEVRLPISAIGTDESNNDTASKAYSQGDYFYKNGIAKAKTSIAQGATFTLNTNYEIKTLAEILQAIESAL